MQGTLLGGEEAAPYGRLRGPRLGAGQFCHRLRGWLSSPQPRRT